MISVLLQSDQLPEFYRAVRDQFTRGGSPVKAVLAILVIVVLVVVVYIVNRFERRVSAPVETNDPQRLFRDMMHKLGLSAEQREQLDILSREMRLENPAVIVLSEKLFDQSITQWRGRSEDPQARELLGRLRARLFPNEVGFVSSAASSSDST